MPSTGLFGPHSLDTTTIDSKLNGTGPGAYALGHVNAQGVFVVKYVGRSDSDLKARLKTHATAKNAYKVFKYGFLKSAKAAFEKECSLYHDFGGSNSLDNTNHPQRPTGTSYDCPDPDCDDLG